MTKTAAHGRSESVVADSQPWLVTLFCGRSARGSPKRKSLARLDDNTVDLLAGKTDISNLVFLKLKINAVKSSDKYGRMAFNNIRQITALCFCNFFFAKKILNKSYSNLFFDRNFVASRTEFANSFSFILPCVLFTKLIEKYYKSTKMCCQ